MAIEISDQVQSELLESLTQKQKRVLSSPKIIIKGNSFNVPRALTIRINKFLHGNQELCKNAQTEQSVNTLMLELLVAKSGLASSMNAGSSGGS